MTTLACFGDSYAGLSLEALVEKGLTHGFNVESDLVDPSLEPLDWLWEHQGRVYDYVNTLPSNAVFYWSTGGIDALNFRPAWQMRSFLNQLIELMDSFPIYHFGYEWWPTQEVNDRFEPLYRACKELDEKHTQYHFVDMRGAVPFNDVTYVDLLHLSAENYQRRVDHAWDTVLRYVV